MTTRRIIKPVPTDGLIQIPSGALLVDGYLDYIEESDIDAFTDAIYVCIQNDDGTFSIPVDNTVGILTTAHTFGGWPLPGAFSNGN